MVGGDGSAQRAAAPTTPMPPSELLSTKNVLLGIGSACLAGMFHFYKRKNTPGFKACWALM